MFIRLGTPSGLRTMSTGVPSGRYGMSSSGRTLAMTPLLPWRPAILSPTETLRFWATDTRTRRFTPGWRSSFHSRRNSRISTTLPRSPCGRRSERVLHLARLLAEDRAQQALLRRQLGLALGRDLADEDVAGADLGADVDDPLLVEVLEGLLADVRDVARDLLGAQLGVPRLDLVLLDVDAREQVVAHEALADDDRVLVVAALPAHERHEDVPAERELAAVGRRAESAIGVAVVDPLADRDDRALVDAGALVAAHELEQPVLVQLARVGLDLDPLGGHAGHDAGAAGDDDLAGVARGARLHAGADDRRLRLEERHRLALHVRAHEGAVGVVVLEERDQRRRHRDDLLGADVHVLDLVRARLRERVPVAARHALADEVALGVERRVGLGDVMLLLLVGREVVDVVGDDRADRERERLLARELLVARAVGERLALLEDDLAVLADEVRAGLVRRAAAGRRARRSA